MQTSLPLRPLLAAAAIGLSAHSLTAAAAEPGVTDTKLILGSVTPVSGPPSLLGNEIVLKHDVRLWTDRYHNLLRILDIPWNVVPEDEDEDEP